MKKILLCLVFLTSFMSYAQKKNKDAASPTKPKLVVGIVVDQMRYDYLYRYYDKYGAGGLKRMMTEGFNCKNNHYHYAATFTGPGHAHIYNGSAPAVSGIVGNEWFDRSLNRGMYVVEDTSVSIIGEGDPRAGQMSPNNLLVTSITDQLRLSNQFKSKVVGVAFKDRGAILPAGHTGTAFWFDTKNGNWITSTYYMKNLPEWVKSFNARKLPQSYTTQKWEPLYPIEQYTESEDDDQPYEAAISGEKKAVFPHEVKLSSLAQTPYGNTLTKEFAISTIEGEKLGQGEATDFLAVSFSTPDYVGHAFGPRSVEIEDTYLRFDKEIEDLLNYLDTHIGKGNYVTFLTADHGVAEIPAFLKKHDIPTGLYLGGEIKKLATNALNQKFGEEKWILAEENYQLYLNYAALESKKVSVNEVFNTVRDAFIKQEGIANVVNLHDFSSTVMPEYYKNLIANVYNAKRCGDMFVVVEPAWFSGYVKGTTHGTIYAYDTHVPLLWYGWGIQKGERVERTQIADISPTLAQLLNILEPNGSIGNPIKELFRVRPLKKKK